MRLIWKLLCVIACLVIGFSVVLPYFSVSAFDVGTISRNMMNSSAWLYIPVLAIAALGLVLSLAGKYLPVVFLGMGSFALFFLQNSQLSIGLGEEIDALLRTKVTNDLGYYFLLVGSVMLILFSVLGLAGKKR